MGESIDRTTLIMCKKLLITNGIIADGNDLFYDKGAILIEGERILQIGEEDKILCDNAEIIDVGGRLVLPGLLNPHLHLYSMLSVGLSPIGEVRNFVENLEKFWWKLDANLDDETIYYSAMLGVMDAVMHGCTMIFDHHASMSYVRGSLRIIADVFRTANICGMLCFETSDRNGENKVDEHIAENIDFFEFYRESHSIHGMRFLHANFTLSDRTLSKIADVKPKDMPIHIHCAEDEFDKRYCIERGYAGAVDRLYSFGLLCENSILAHCIHLSDRDYSLLDEIKPIIVSNPESNAKNRVGRMDLGKIGKYILGTDGMSRDMIKTLRSHFLLAEKQPKFDELREIFFVETRRIKKKFFRNAEGLQQGMRADIAVLDYIPATPISPENLVGHLIFGAQDGKAFMTIAGGKIVYRDGKIAFVDQQNVTREAQKAAKALRKRFYG